MARKKRIEDECPLGGDISNNCADCIYAIDYHYQDGECIRRLDDEETDRP